ncbi:hypothetical protein EON65_06275 [archaeon]|nr:MAG: hypothetical protein EON65_06275 [archaeon]
MEVLRALIYFTTEEADAKTKLAVKIDPLVSNKLKKSKKVAELRVVISAQAVETKKRRNIALTLINPDRKL